MSALRKFLTRIAIRLGPDHIAIRPLLERRCRQFGCRFRVLDNTVELQKDDRVLVLARQHFVYTLDLAERFEVYFDPVTPSEKAGRRVVDYSKPRLQTYRRTGLQFELASFPEEDDAIESYFRRYRPRRGGLVFDVGAHCGVSTYHLSTLVGSEGKVIALEPDPLNHSLLLRNIARHKLTNVTPVRAALGAANGTAVFQAEGTIGSCLSHYSSRATVGQTETVETLTLSEAFRRWGTPDFCKIDIEGAEIEALDAARDILPNCNTQFALDTNHVVNGSRTDEAVEKIFKECGLWSESERSAGTTWAGPQTPESNHSAG